MRECRSRLRLLEIGPRPELLEEQRLRVNRAEAWHQLAKQDLAHVRAAHEEELARLEKLIAQRGAELDCAEAVFARAGKLIQKGALSEEKYREQEMESRACQARFEQAQAQKRAEIARGTIEAEAELARRERELAEARSTLSLLEVGSRPEEIEAERAHLARLEEEARYWTGLRAKLEVASRVSGVMITPHLKEKIGQYVKEGDLIGEVHARPLEVEIAVPEQDAARVRIGQRVELKARSLPFETFQARVDRIAPAAVPDKELSQSIVTVSCRLAPSASQLRPGMTGHARIACGPRPIGEIVAERALRFLRTEFWW